MKKFMIILIGLTAVTLFSSTFGLEATDYLSFDQAETISYDLPTIMQFTATETYVLEAFDFADAELVTTEIQNQGGNYWLETYQAFFGREYETIASLEANNYQNTNVMISANHQNMTELAPYFALEPPSLNYRL